MSQQYAQFEEESGEESQSQHYQADLPHETMPGQKLLSRDVHEHSTETLGLRLGLMIVSMAFVFVIFIIAMTTPFSVVTVFFALLFTVIMLLFNLLFLFSSRRR